jgi:hypothetical protein
MCHLDAILPGESAARKNGDSMVCREIGKMEVTKSENQQDS